MPSRWRLQAGQPPPPTVAVDLITWRLEQAEGNAARSDPRTAYAQGYYDGEVAAYTFALIYLGMERVPEVEPAPVSEVCS